MTSLTFRISLSTYLLYLCTQSASSFSPNLPTYSRLLSNVDSSERVLNLVPSTISDEVNNDDDEKSRIENNGNLLQRPLETILRGVGTASLIALTCTSMMGMPSTALADEYGKEVEAPTLFTGESVMICTKRGPLGACLKTELRTSDNDNDKASKYFRDPSKTVQEKDLAMRQTAEDDEGSDLLNRLLRQTEENRERNEQIVRMKTLENNQGASFGPFDRQVVIMNTDEKTFTLLENPQAMRLKKAGYIKDRRFVKQPSQEVLDEALESPDFGETIKGFFGVGGGESGDNK